MSLHKNPEVVFLTPYPHDTAPGQRFRFEQYINLMKHGGYELRVFSFLSYRACKKLYSTDSKLLTIALVILGFLKRFLQLSAISQADFVFIFREAAPVGPPFIEWIIASLFKKKIIYDFDDAIWLTDKTHEGWFEKKLRWRNKVSSICKWSYRISCGNKYLYAYAHQFNKNVVLNPTTVDTTLVHNPQLFQAMLRSAQPDEKGGKKEIVIGWTGSHSTLKYLEALAPVLRKLGTMHSQLKFLVIADRKPNLPVTFDFVLWNKETEAADLLRMDIGIMPLPDDEWTKGKCGFKALQYMAMEIPCVVSPVGVNAEMVEHGVNGFLAATETEWVSFLHQLICDPALRKRLGHEGRKKVMEKFSVQANQKNFLSLFAASIA